MQPWFCFRNYFQSEKSLAIDASVINDQLRLIPTQLQIQVMHAGFDFNCCIVTTLLTSDLFAKVNLK